MKRKLFIVGIGIAVISLVSFSSMLFKPSEVSATGCASTCSQTFNAAMSSCRSQCGEYYASTSSNLDACKTGCALYMTTISSCSGKVVNTTP